MSISKISQRNYTPEISIEEKKSGFKWGPRMHAFDGGVFIDCTFNKKGHKWWVVQDGYGKKKERRFALTKEYYYKTYRI